jgi:hypothetical protein
VAPKVAGLLEEAEEDLLADKRSPRDHWSKIRSTTPLERVDREIARRSDVVGIYPDDAAILRLAAAVLVEVNDEWLVMHRDISHSSMVLLATDEHGPCGPVGRPGQLWRERWPAPERPPVTGLELAGEAPAADLVN